MFLRCRSLSSPIRNFAARCLLPRRLPSLISSRMTSLEWKEDRFNGVIVQSASLPDHGEDFVHTLQTLLRSWSESGKRAIWMEIPSLKSNFIPLAVNQLGFQFHHADENALMLVKWLPKEPHRLPSCASHQVGIAGFVMNPDGSVLVVQERNGPLKGTGIWKIPTGLLDRGEDIPDGAVREIFEETGVRSSFEAVVCIRQAHGFFFGNSDLLFICVLKPCAGPIQLRKQEEEIADVCWFPFEDFISQDFFQERATLQQMMIQCKLFHEGKNCGFVGHSMQGRSNRKDFVLWSANGGDNESKM